MRPYAKSWRKIADTFVCIYPNAGLPNPMCDTGFDETPDVTSSLLKEFAESGFVNIAGGCCGTTPEHIRAIAETVEAHCAAQDAGGAAGDAPVRPGAVHDRRQTRCSSTSASAPTSPAPRRSRA